MPKKVLGMIAMTYGNIYVAQISLANPAQAVKAIIEAEAYDGPSLIIAYSHCIAHGIKMDSAIEGCKDAVNSGHWPLYRYNPDLARKGMNPLQLDSKEPTISFEDYAAKQNRFTVLKSINPDSAEMLMAKANKETAKRFKMYKAMADLQLEGEDS
jgi:pyruvate-ferredoxin/flavodoxin oxidoreductase